MSQIRIFCAIFAAKLQKKHIVNLIIDIGNNSAKFFLFSGNSIILHGRKNNTSFHFVQELSASYNVESIIVSSVIGIDDEQKSIIDAAATRVIWLSKDTPVPIKSEYRTPHTLGSDRLAAAIGAMCEAPGRNILIIDAGSAITIDFVDSGGTFRGGNISPGIKMRLAALHSFTNRLPSVEKEGETPALGYDTDTAIRSGVIHGICHEIDGYITDFKNKFPDLLVFLTGGDEKTLINKIKSHIFADRFLVAKGLNKILENIS